MQNASDIRVSIRKAMLFWTNPNANFTDIMHEIGSKRGVKCMRCSCPTIRIIELARDRHDILVRKRAEAEHLSSWCKRLGVNDVI